MTSLVLHDLVLDEGCYKVRLLLAALGLLYRSVAADMLPGAEQARPPRPDLLGTPPVLEEGTAVLRDPEAILVYLALRHDAARTWLPADPLAFAEVMAWLVFAARDLHAAVLARRHAMFDAPADAQAVLAAARRGFRAMEDHMSDRRLAGGAWFVGGGPTLADIALFPAIALSRDIGIDHEAYPALRRWMRAVRTIPGFTTMPGIPDFH